MLKSLTGRLAVTASLALAASGAMAANVAIDTANPVNGLIDIYSATFDGALVACAPGSTYCSFFGGDPGATRAITTTPNPSGVINAVPGGIGPLGGFGVPGTGNPGAPIPVSGSFLDLTLSGGNTLVTLGASSVTFGTINLVTAAGGGLNANAGGGAGGNAGIAIRTPGAAIAGALTPAGGGSTGDTVAVNGLGQAVFQIQGGVPPAIDFSKFSTVVTSCVGGACGLVTFDVLSLDIVRYVLFLDYDPTFTSFTGNLIGQTANSSLVYATLNSAPPIPVPAAVWLMASGLGLLGALRRKSRAA